MPINFLRSQTRTVTLWSGLSDTLSKAFWKSTKVTVTTQLALRTSLHVSVRCINNNTVEYSLRYAHWLSVTRLSFTLYTCEMTVSKTHDSSILLGTLGRERGWYSCLSLTHHLAWKLDYGRLVLKTLHFSMLWVYKPWSGWTCELQQFRWNSVRTCWFLWIQRVHCLPDYISRHFCWIWGARAGLCGVVTQG